MGQKQSTNIEILQESDDEAEKTSSNKGTPSSVSKRNIKKKFYLGNTKNSTSIQVLKDYQDNDDLEGENEIIAKQDAHKMAFQSRDEKETQIGAEKPVKKKIEKKIQKLRGVKKNLMTSGKNNYLGIEENDTSNTFDDSEDLESPNTAGNEYDEEASSVRSASTSGHEKNVKKQKQKKKSSKILPLSSATDPDGCTGNASLFTARDAAFDSFLGIHNSFPIEIPQEPCIPIPMTDLTATNFSMMSSMELYNRMCDGKMLPYIHSPGYMLLVDTRELDDYKENHITTAVHVSDLDNSDVIQIRTNFNYVVIYDSHGNLNSSADLIHEIHEKLPASNDIIHTLNLGYEHFHDKYPFLCTDEIYYTETRREGILIYPSIIIENKLFLGSGDQATHIDIVENLKISSILNLSTEHPNAFIDKINYKHVKDIDDWKSNSQEELLATADFIHESLQELGGIVLVHCNLGVSSSAAILIAYFMLAKHWTLKDAYHYLRMRRPHIDPNRNSLTQLSHLEAKLFGNNLTNIDDLWL